MDFFDFREAMGEQADPATERLAKQVIDAAWEVYRQLGPLLPERSYELALSHELTLRNIPHICQSPIDIIYKGHPIGEGRIDILVADLLVIEIKAAESLTPQHKAQVLSYLKLKHLRLGLLINFNAYPFRLGLKRVVLDPVSPS
jgi:GxxExxY protein